MHTRPQDALALMISLAALLMSVSLSEAASMADVPPEIADLCKTLGHLIINKGDPAVLDIVKDDFAGRARPAGGGVDIGAIECDGIEGAGTPPFVRFPAPANVRREVQDGIGRVAWDWPAAPDTLLVFLLYVRAPGQPFGDGEAPTAVVRKTDPLTLIIDCRRLPLSAPGPWQASMRAMSTTGEFSDLSNTIELTWSATHGCVDVPAAGGPPVVVRPTPPLPPRLASR